MDLLMARARESGHSRLPVLRRDGARERVVGVVDVAELLYADRIDPQKWVGDALRPAVYFDEGMRLEDALRQLQRTGERLAIVLGRDRVEIGIVSLQDILKLIFGNVQPGA